MISKTIALAALASYVAADHYITVVNNCGVTTNPIVVDTSCTYSGRCGETNAYTGATSVSLPAGEEYVFELPDDFVGRVCDTSSSSSCASDCSDCSMLEFNFDDPSGGTCCDQSYDLSNIQGFTRGMEAVPYPDDVGCETKTCFEVDCGDDQAYPPGDEGDNDANTSCGEADLGIALYLCAFGYV